MNSIKYPTILLTSETPQDDGAGWMITAVLSLIIIGSLVYFISRRNK